MKSFRLWDAEDHLSDEGASNGTRVVPAGTILMLVRGMTLHNDVPICQIQEPMAFNQDVKAIVAKPGISNTFIAYWLLAHKPDLLGMVDSSSHGTGRLYQDHLKQMAMKLP